MKAKNIFITWHYTTHGIAYLKHILSAYYEYGIENIYKEKEISQEEMNRIIDDNDNEKFVFDKVFYLTAPQKAFDKLSLRRIDYISNIVDKDDYIKSNKTLNTIWSSIIKIRLKQYELKGQFPKLEDEIRFVKSNHIISDYNKWISTIWRDIHHYTIEDQILWFGKYSNGNKIYNNGTNFINKQFEITDFRNAIEISKKLTPFIQELKKKYTGANFIINASLGSNETQVVWQVLSELNILPPNTTLIQTYDNKEKRNLRFKPFVINKLPNKIVTEMSNLIQLYDNPVSKSRKLAKLKMDYYIKSGFAILLLGERGIGKTRLAEESKKKGQNLISVNCASFTDNNIAQSILFGHSKGAFSDATSEEIGEFVRAKDGILFLDEIHHLDKMIQAKLMKALQTNKNNEFTIKRLGDGKETKIMATIILASNNSIEELKEKLLPDFYDRVTQLGIEVPSLRESKEIIFEEFEGIWEQMKFNLTYDFNKTVSKDNKLKKWITKLPLYGNYRDLQKIAIYYKTFLDFDNEIKSLLNTKKAFEFTKQEYEKYISFSPQNESESFPIDKSAEDIINIYKGRLAKWAIKKFGGAPNAVAHFKEKGGKTTANTIYGWEKYLTSEVNNTKT